MRKSSIFRTFAALAIVAAGAVFGHAHAQTVTGFLQDGTGPHAIPFTPYADGTSPIITTQAYADQYAPTVQAFGAGSVVVSKLGHSATILVTPGTSSNNAVLTINSGASYGLVAGDHFDVIAFNPNGKTTTLNFADSVTSADPSQSGGITLSNQIVMTGGQARRFIYRGTAAFFMAVLN